MDLDHSYDLLLISELEGDLLDKIQVADPGAATPLYTRFAPGLRVLIRHKLPDVDPETAVFHVLVTVARAVRLGEVRTANELVARVREVANAFIEETTAGRRSESTVQENELRTIVSQIDPSEREILTRFYRLGQSENEISRAMNIPPETVLAVKRKLRQGFLAQK